MRFWYLSHMTKVAINPYLANILFLKIVSALTSAANIQMHLSLFFIMEANTMNPIMIWIYIVCNIGFQKL